jgi:hypothetical protein
LVKDEGKTRLTLIERLVIWWNYKPPNPHCECEQDCGAGVEYNGRSIKNNWCPTVMERLAAPFRQYPWNQVGIDGQVLEVDEGNTTWKLKNKDGVVTDSGYFTRR